MEELMKLRQAARLIGVSPGRLYRAIAAGRLAAASGGGPGKAMLVSVEALQAFCRSEGLPPPEAGVGEEHSAPYSRPATDALAQQALESLMARYLAQIMERQSGYIEAFLREELSHLVNRVLERVVDEVSGRLTERFSTVVEHLERSDRPAAIRSLPASTYGPTLPEQRAELSRRLRAMQAEGASLQAMADRLNADGVQTLSGKGRWHRSSVGKLLAEA